MILDELVLHNFGSYLGRQHLSLLPTSSERPVVLIGGLNGAGKTTLLDALQLALYGKLAYTSNRGTLAYDEYLRRSIHRSVDPKTGASVELQFRCTVEGELHTYRVRRVWATRGSGLREDVEVLRDGHLDRVLTETWDEHVETLLPRRISPLFFFDGEKIEALADPYRSAELLATAVHSLLGIDIVEQLGTDLVVLERRKRSEVRRAEQRRTLEQVRAELDTIQEDRRVLNDRRGTLTNERDWARKQLEQLDERFRVEGGEIFEHRELLEAEHGKLQRRLKEAEAVLRDLASGVAPLLLVRDLCLAVEQQDRIEDRAAQAQLLDQALAERDDWLLREFADAIPPQSLNTLRHRLSEDREQRAREADVGTYLDLSTEARSSLRSFDSEVFPAVIRQTQEGLRATRLLREQLDEIERKLARVPDQDAIALVIRERATARDALATAEVQLAAIEQEIERVHREHTNKEATLAGLIQRQVEDDFEQDAAWRTITHAGKVRDTLQRFRSAVVGHHAARIEQLVLESFRQLLRKESFVTGLSIDPESFTIELRGPNGDPLPSERLSAGERQLLAVALLWGLARAAGRALPVVVDTPLGRLDAVHRAHLIERYFPQASHQVLLLSTDQEITGEFLDALQPFIGASYRLEYSDESSSTRIEAGYFALKMN